MCRAFTFLKIFFAGGVIVKPTSPELRKQLADVASGGTSIASLDVKVFVRRTEAIYCCLSTFKSLRFCLLSGYTDDVDEHGD